MKNLYTSMTVLSCILFLQAVQLKAQAGRNKVEEGNALFTQEKYEDALNKYRDAELDNPQSPRIQYNIGSALYKQGQFDEAFKAYEKVLSAKESDLHFRSYYNMGNTLYRMNKLPESILSYKKSLELNPDDYDAKYNLEFVRNKLKQQQQQNQQQDQKQEQQDQQQEQNKDQEQMEQQESEGEQQEQEQQPQPEKAEELSKEEAERILDALKNDEKDLQEKRKAPSSGRVKVKKDW